MDIHKNARLSYRSREALARFVVEQGATRKAAAVAFRVSSKPAAMKGHRFSRAATCATSSVLEKSQYPSLVF